VWLACQFYFVNVHVMRRGETTLQRQNLDNARTLSTHPRQWKVSSDNCWKQPGSVRSLTLPEHCSTPCPKRFLVRQLTKRCDDVGRGSTSLRNGVCGRAFETSSHHTMSVCTINPSHAQGNRLTRSLRRFYYLRVRARIHYKNRPFRERKTRQAHIMSDRGDPPPPPPALLTPERQTTRQEQTPPRTGRAPADEYDDTQVSASWIPKQA
jgi:hypothetical protein